jgi:hypothetical protein
MTKALNVFDLQCPATGKQAYVDEETARRFLAVNQSRPDYDPSLYGRRAADVYQCPSCGWWHLTGRKP